MTDKETRTNIVRQSHNKFSFVPVNGKKPIQKGWTGRKKESLEQAETYAEQGNIGIRTGRASGGLVVIDVDNGADISRLDFPETVTVQTGSGGKHYYYKCPIALRNSTSKLAHHVDVRADRGCVVAVGSRHENGNVYEYIKSPEEYKIALLPSRIIEKLIKDDNPRKRLYEAWTEIKKATNGTRNDTLNRYAFPIGAFIREGTLSQEEVEWSLKNANKLSKNPLPDPEFRKTLKTSLETGIEKAELPSMGQEGKELSLKPEDVTLQLGDNLPDLKPDLIEGVVRLGDKLSIIAPSKAYKTHMLMQLSTAVATGREWIGLQCERANVLFVDMELQPVSFQNRLEKIYQAMKVKIEPGSFDRLSLRGQGIKIKKLALETISLNRLKDGGYGLIVIDPLYRFLAGGDENSAGFMASIFMELESIAQNTGAVVVYTHHFTKGDPSGKEAIDRGSGSGVIGRDADAMLVFTRHTEDQAFTVEAILRDHPPIDPFVVQVEYPLTVRNDDLDPTNLKTHGKKTKALTVDDVLEHITDFPQTRDEIERKVKEKTGRGVNQIAKVFKQALDEGLMEIEKTPRPGTNALLRYRKKWKD
ncbi:AAA family ATPase [Planctomycetota bacterium]